MPSKSGGGRGIAVRCDHAVEEDVQALFTQIRDEQSKLDVLVNNTWTGNESADMASFGDPFWNRSNAVWERMIDGGARLHLITTRLAVPLIAECPGALVICTTFHDRGKYLGDLHYDLAKAMITRLAFAMACDLKPMGTTCVALSPGWMRTERVVAATPASALGQTESVEYIGRAVAALASSSDHLERTGEVLLVADLAKEFGFTDCDGKTPGPFRVAD